MAGVVLEMGAIVLERRPRAQLRAESIWRWLFIGVPVLGRWTYSGWFWASNPIGHLATWVQLAFLSFLQNESSMQVPLARTTHSSESPNPSLLLPQLCFAGRSHSCPRFGDAERHSPICRFAGEGLTGFGGAHQREARTPERAALHALLFVLLQMSLLEDLPGGEVAKCQLLGRPQASVMMADRWTYR